MLLLTIIALAMLIALVYKIITVSIAWLISLTLYAASKVIDLYYGIKSLFKKSAPLDDDVVYNVALCAI